jgi:3-oxocholest-4-en-26-oyl-CoA dehydrogenase beta subunit
VNFEYTEQQTMLLTMARDFLREECPRSRTRALEKDERGYDPAVWRRMAELGWMGLVLPEIYSGSGADFMDLVVLMEEMGRNILPGPFFPTVALAALPILEYGSGEQKERYLPAIARGEKIWTLAAGEQDGGCDYPAMRTTARPDDGGYTLNGEKAFVPCAGAADYMLVPACTGKSEIPHEGLTLFIVGSTASGVDIERIPTLTGENLCHMRFRDVRLGAEDVLGTPGNAAAMIEAIMEKAGLLKCAEVSGACRAVLEMSSAYARERVQFGRPIGAFQAVQHRLVDMLTDVEGLQYLVYQAAWLMGMGMPCSEQVAIAKVKANDVYQRVALDGVKIHGAIGFSQDHDIGLFYRRVLASKFFPYDAAHYLEKVADSIGL